MPRRTSSVRNLRRPWAPREHSLERTKKAVAPPPCAVSPAMCRRLGHAILCSQGKRGRGAVPSLLCTGGFCLQSRRGARKLRIFFLPRVLAARWRSHLPMGLHGVSRKDLSERARVHAGLRAGERASGLAAGYNAGQSAIRFSSHGDRARKPHSTARAQRERMCGAIPMQH